MKYKYAFIIILFLNIISTVISYAFLIHGHFERNYGLEYLGLQTAIISLVLTKQRNEWPEIYSKLIVMSIVFIIANAIPDIIFLIYSTIKSPHFFWWQNFEQVRIGQFLS